MAGVGVLCSKLNFIPYNFYKRDLKILNSKLQILIFGYTYSPLKFDGGECGEYGWVLWASWLRTEPPNGDHWPVTTDRSRFTGQPFQVPGVEGSFFSLPAAVSR